jgi:hypothetical protein
MDYARFNYIAQPEDGIKNFFPKIGEYDDWAIKYGYKPIPNIDLPEEAEPILNEWILEKAGNPVYRYGRQRRDPIDPTAQTEDIGDDSMEASELGIANLKRIALKLMEWGTEPGENYDDLQELYNNVVGQYNRYMGHVTSNVGGVYEYYKTSDEDGAVYTHVDEEKQARAIAFLNKQLFATPEWLIDPAILSRIEEEGIVDRIKALQTRTFSRLLDGKRVKRILENEALNGANAYTAVEMMTDLRRSVFSELRSGKEIDTYRRNLQKNFVEELGNLLNTDNDDLRSTDIPSIAKGNLTLLKVEINRGIGRQSNTSSRFHLQYLSDRIDQLLNPKG